MNQELINRAHELRDHGFTTGEIADELNVSMETVFNSFDLVTHFA